MTVQLDQRDTIILDTLKTHGTLNRKQLNEQLPTPISKTILVDRLQYLMTHGYVRRDGRGKTTRYTVITATPEAIAPGVSTQTETPSTASQASPAENKDHAVVAVHDTTPSRVTLTGDDPPLVDVKVTNPITYFKRWWRRMLGGEGVYLKLSFRIKPFTAILIIFAFFTIQLGIDTVRTIIAKTPLRNTPLYNYLPAPSPTPNPWRETAFSGTLQYSELEEKFFLITSQGQEAIRLTVPDNIDLTPFVYSDIFALGLYNEFTNTLHVTDASNLEVLPYETYPVPTTEPTILPVATPSAE